VARYFTQRAVITAKMLEVVAAIAAFHTGIPGVSSGLTYKKIWKTHRFPRIIYKWWVFDIVRLLEGTRALIAGLKHVWCSSIVTPQHDAPD
jgi:hypothetical protein